jgi:hypothetical protein
MERESPELASLRDDCLHALLALAAYEHSVRVMSAIASGQGSRDDLHLQSIALREQENALIVRACRFDDDGKNQTGLRSALKSVEETMTGQEIDTIRLAIKKFRQSIVPLKTQLRNRIVAHLHATETQPHDSSVMTIRRTSDRTPDLGSVIDAFGVVISITDSIAGRRLGYSRKAGSLEAERDLRPLVGKSSS